MILDVEMRILTDAERNIQKLQMRKLVKVPWRETWYVEGREVPKSGFEDKWTDWQDVPIVAASMAKESST